MTPQEFKTNYPRVMRWIRETLDANAEYARSVASARFRRLPLYFNRELLTSVKFVTIERVPLPPLSAMGLAQFAEYERGDFDGVTYLDTFFLKKERAADERIHFHELIHVIQWRKLGPKRFLEAYTNCLQNYGYRNNPFEVMAFKAEAEFSRSSRPFDGEKLVEEELDRFTPPLKRGDRASSPPKRNRVRFAR